MSATTILVADDHPIVRQGLRTLLEAEPDFTVVGEAADGLEAVRSAERLRPHLLVVDVLMPGLNGLEVAREVARGHGTRVVVLSMHDAPAYVERAFRYGATSYVLKDSTPSELVHAVRETARGRRYLSPVLAPPEPPTARGRGAVVDPYDLLTSRERAVFQLTAEGFTAAAIGERLFIGRRTVETHRVNLMQKLSLHSHSELIRYAVRRGLLPIDPA
jgi:two-component system, NarL family, response regulator NreC